jgi:hypothetical protein
MLTLLIAMAISLAVIAIPIFAVVSNQIEQNSCDPFKQIFPPPNIPLLDEFTESALFIDKIPLTLEGEEEDYAVVVSAAGNNSSLVKISITNIATEEAFEYYITATQSSTIQQFGADTIIIEAHKVCGYIHRYLRFRPSTNVAAA